MEKARQWATRIMHESKMHYTNKFITLTYDNKYLSQNKSLNKTDITLFLKRLRKHFSKQNLTLRFYQCGEYGDKFNRPHHHLALFVSPTENLTLPALLSEPALSEHIFGDEVLIRTGEKKLYESKILQSIWGKGLCSIADLNEETASYIAKYVTKKITGAPAKHHYKGRMPEYTTMSRRPGIGKPWHDLYNQDVKNIDGVLSKGFILKPPRYYDNLYDKIDPLNLKERKEKRVAEAKHYTYRELMAKKAVLKQKYKEYKRSFENAN